MKLPEPEPDPDPDPDPEQEEQRPIRLPEFQDAYVPLLGEQYSPGASDRLEWIYNRADEIVKGAEEAAQRLAIGSSEQWPELLTLLTATGQQLGEECFHDGALGPGTAMLNPGPYIERIREAFQYQEVAYTLPEEITVRLHTIGRLMDHTGLSFIVVRVPDRWSGGQPLEGLQELMELVEAQHPDPSKLCIEVLVAIEPDLEKWIGGGMPRMDAEGPKLVVDGPPGLQRSVEQFFDRE